MSEIKRIVHNEVDYLLYRQGMDNTIEIFDLAVNSERGKGRGTALINELLTLNPRVVYAFTRADNLKARAFYYKFGFNQYVIRGFYANGDGVIATYENSLFSKPHKQ